MKLDVVFSRRGYCCLESSSSLLPLTHYSVCPRLPRHLSSLGTTQMHGLIDTHMYINCSFVDSSQLDSILFRCTNQSIRQDKAKQLHVRPKTTPFFKRKEELSWVRFKSLYMYMYVQANVPYSLYLWLVHTIDIIVVACTTGGVGLCSIDDLMTFLPLVWNVIVWVATK